MLSMMSSRENTKSQKLLLQRNHAKLTICASPKEKLLPISVSSKTIHQLPLKHRATSVLSIFGQTLFSSSETKSTFSLTKTRLTISSKIP